MDSAADLNMIDQVNQNQTGGFFVVHIIRLSEYGIIDIHKKSMVTGISQFKIHPQTERIQVSILHMGTWHKPAHMNAKPVGLYAAGCLIRLYPGKSGLVRGRLCQKDGSGFLRGYNIARFNLITPVQLNNFRCCFASLKLQYFDLTHCNHFIVDVTIDFYFIFELPDTDIRIDEHIGFYDLGNDLFQNMLDKRMNYSCAYWKDAESLDEAQENKLELICKKLYLKPGMRVLDIGCGWGAFGKYSSSISEGRLD